MTKTARTVLLDCGVALAQLREVDGPGPTWRVRYASCLALVRAIGHVLDKADRSTPSLSSAIDSWWAGIMQGKPQPEIFHCFIEEDRNLILKEYETKVGHGVTVHVPTATFSFGSGAKGKARGGGEGFVEHPARMTSGYFEGADPTDLIEQAIEWWKTQLDQIDTDAAQ